MMRDQFVGAHMQADERQIVAGQRQDVLRQRPLSELASERK